MTIRHDCKGGRKCYLKSLPDWGFLKDCFPRKIEPTDLDGLVEINGRALILEWKRTGARMTDGQRYALEGLTRGGKDDIVVFVIYGDCLTMTAEVIQEVRHGEVREKIPCTNELVRERAKEWGQWADRQKKRGIS